MAQGHRELIDIYHGGSDDAPTVTMKLSDASSDKSGFIDVALSVHYTASSFHAELLLDSRGGEEMIIRFSPLYDDATVFNAGVCPGRRTFSTEGVSKTPYGSWPAVVPTYAMGDIMTGMDRFMFYAAFGKLKVLFYDPREPGYGVMEPEAAARFEKDLGHATHSVLATAHRCFAHLFAE